MGFNSGFKGLRIQSSLRSFIVFCAEIWKFHSVYLWCLFSGVLNHGIRKTNTSCPVLATLSAAVLILLTLSVWPVELHVTHLCYVKALHIEMISTVKNSGCMLNRDWHEAATDKLPVVLEVILMLTSWIWYF